MDASQELEAQLERERSERLRLAASLETTAAQLASAETKLELAERQSVEWKQRAESEAAARRQVNIRCASLPFYRPPQ